MTEKEFENIFNSNNFSLVCFAKSYVGDLLAEDFVQDAFISLWQSIDKDHSSPKTLLFTCVRNACLNHLKRYRKFEKIEKDIKFVLDISESNIESKIIKGDLTERIINEIKTAPKKRGEVMKLYYGDFSPNEISDMLKISVNTVNVHIKRFIDGFEKENKNEILITFKGKRQSLVKWANEMSIPCTTLYSRIRAGINIEAALRGK